jgi:hypothetical protein
MQDQELNTLFKDIADNPLRVLGHGEQLLSSHPEKLSVLKAIRKASQRILSDLEEHGSVNEVLYGGKSSSYFREILKKVESDIRDAEKQGLESPAFDAYLKARDSESEAALAHFEKSEKETQDKFKESQEKALDEPDLMDTEKKIAQSMKAEALHPDAFDKALQAAVELPMWTPGFAKAIATFIVQAIEASKLGGLSIGEHIAMRYVDRLDESHKLPQNPLLEELAAQILFALHENKEYGPKAIQEIVPKEITNPMLAHRVACVYANLKKSEEAFQYLAVAVSLGLQDDMIAGEGDYVSLRKDPRFAALRQEAYEKRTAATA